MRFWLIALFMLFCPQAFAQPRPPPVIEFNSVPDPLKLPDNLYLGEVSGVAVDSKGHAFVLTRGNTTGPAYAAAAAKLLEFDANGKFLREIGHNLYAWSFAQWHRRPGGQYLGDRQGLGHGDQVHPRRPRRHGVRAQAGSLRRRDRPAETSKLTTRRRAQAASAR